jgi:hypothetical protein
LQTNIRVHCEDQVTSGWFAFRPAS